LLLESRRLDRGNVLCLPALGALGDVELNALALLEGAETVRLNRGVMDEYVLAVVTAEKSKTLSVVKPLDCALFHDVLLLVDFTAERNVEVIAVERLLGTGKDFLIEFYDLIKCTTGLIRESAADERDARVDYAAGGVVSSFRSDTCGLSEFSFGNHLIGREG
jgi:hypothetical protein